MVDVGRNLGAVLLCKNRPYALGHPSGGDDRMRAFAEDMLVLQKRRSDRSNETFGYVFSSAAWTVRHELRREQREVKDLDEFLEETARSTWSTISVGVDAKCKRRHDDYWPDSCTQHRDAELHMSFYMLLIAQTDLLAS